MTIITNENIKQLVRLYIEKKELPDLPEKIGDWDTSRVTDMKGLFEDYNDFNEPLHWDTSNVTDMSRMFFDCIKFNQHLTWETRNVTDMSYMFAKCKEFNQPLTLETSNVTNMIYMYGYTAIEKVFFHKYTPAELTIQCKMIYVFICMGIDGWMFTSR